MRNTSYHPARLHQDRRSPFGIGTFCLVSNLWSKWITSYLSHIYASSIRLCLFILIICVTFMVPSCHSICIWLQDWEVGWIFFWGFPCILYLSRFLQKICDSSISCNKLSKSIWNSPYFIRIGDSLSFLKTQDESQTIQCYSLNPSYFLRLLLH